MTVKTAIPAGGSIHGSVEATVYDNGTVSSGTLTIDWNNGNDQEVEVDGSFTLAFTDPPGPAHLCLRMTTGADGGYTITPPSNLYVPYGYLAATTGTFRDYLSLTFDGTDYWGVFVRGG